MKKSTITKIIFFPLCGISFIQMQPIYSSSTILNCSGDIPKGASGIIKASSYKVEEEKIDICKKNPVANSIKGYVKEIFFLQFLHLPSKNIQLKIGILSNHFS